MRSDPSGGAVGFEPEDFHVQRAHRPLSRDRTRLPNFQQRSGGGGPEADVIERGTVGEDQTGFAFISNVF